MPDVIKDRLDDAALFVVFREGDDPACLEGLATRLDLLAKTAAELGFAGLRDKAEALAGIASAQKNSGAADWEAITGELDILQGQYRLMKDQGEPPAEVPGGGELPAAELSLHAGTPEENCAGQYSSLDEVHVSRLVDLAGELRSVQAGLRNALTEHTGDLRLSELLQRLHQVGGAIRNSALALHTLPVHGLFEDLAQYALQLARQDNRRLRVATGGSGTAVDRSTVKKIAEPLRTMIRCGLEFAAREAETVLHLNAARTSASVRLELLFDMPSRGSFFPEDSDNLAGAREALERIGARVDCRFASSEKKRLAVVISLPSSHRAIEGLLVRCREWQFVLPTSSIREIFLPAAGQLTMAGEGFSTMLYRNRLYPAVRLEQAFGMAGADTASGMLAVIVTHDDRAVCLLVDELLGKEEVVVKSLGPALAGIANLAGGAILADGRVGLVIDVAGLCRGLRGREAQRLNVSIPGCGP